MEKLLQKVGGALLPWFVTGLTEGEGCFAISFSKRNKMKFGIEVRPSFSLSQHKANLLLLQRVQSYFAVGALRFSRRDATYKYETRSIADIQRAIVPHFNEYPLYGTKKNDFALFAQICRLIAHGKHRNKDYLREIIDLSYQMNSSGARRYTKQELLRVLSE